jgi:hypothetical protein
VKTDRRANGVSGLDSAGEVRISRWQRRCMPHGDAGAVHLREGGGEEIKTS